MRDLGVADISDKATDVWANVSWITGRNQGPKAVKHPVFEGPTSFGRR